MDGASYARRWLEGSPILNLKYVRHQTRNNEKEKCSNVGHLFVDPRSSLSELVDAVGGTLGQVGRSVCWMAL